MLCLLLRKVCKVRKNIVYGKDSEFVGSERVHGIFYLFTTICHISCEAITWYLADLSLFGKIMEAIDQMDEDQLIEYALRLSIQDNCKFPLLTPIERYVIHHHFLLHFGIIMNKFNYSVKCQNQRTNIPVLLSFHTASSENLRILKAIEIGSLVFGICQNIRGLLQNTSNIQC